MSILNKKICYIHQVNGTIYFKISCLVNFISDFGNNGNNLLWANNLDQIVTHISYHYKSENWELLGNCELL